MSNIANFILLESKFILTIKQFKTLYREQYLVEWVISQTKTKKYHSTHWYW